MMNEKVTIGLGWLLTIIVATSGAIIKMYADIQSNQVLIDKMDKIIQKHDREVYSLSTDVAKNSQSDDALYIEIQDRKDYYSRLEARVSTLSERMGYLQGQLASKKDKQ